LATTIEKLKQAVQILILVFLTYPVATLSDIVGRVVLAFDQLGCELIQRLDLLFLGV
jgi:hypothetical protein